ncbi:MAG: hypothetical protein ACU833_09950 [Gammaproteobacteria bacterium]
MTDITKTIFAIVGFFIVGFIIVGTSDKSDQEMQQQAVIRNYQLLSKMASDKCPAVVLKHTGERVYEPSSTDSDKQTFVKLVYSSDKGKFKKAECTLSQSVGGVSLLVIDGETVISK